MELKVSNLCEDLGFYANNMSVCPSLQGKNILKARNVKIKTNNNTYLYFKSFKPGGAQDGPIQLLIENG